MPVVNVLHDLVCSEEVTGPIDGGSVNDVSDEGTGGLATELSREDGPGAEVTITSLPHSTLQLPLDGGLHILSLSHLWNIKYIPINLANSYNL